MPPNARSRGYATLSVVSILTLIFSALALSSTRHVITDSHAMRNQLLAKRALAAADGGIDMAWSGSARSTARPDRVICACWRAAGRWPATRRPTRARRRTRAR